MMLPVMSRLAHRVTPIRPGSRVWWIRVLMTGVFVVWFNATAVHLVIEPHPEFHGHRHPAPVDDCLRGQLHSHERDCHPPHLASDHGYLLMIRTFGPELPPADMAGAPGVEPPDPPAGQPPSRIDLPHWPGTDPPNPGRPRAPPLV